MPETGQCMLRSMHCPVYIDIVTCVCCNIIDVPESCLAKAISCVTSNIPPNFHHSAPECLRACEANGMHPHLIISLIDCILPSTAALRHVQQKHDCTCQLISQCLHITIECNTALWNVSDYAESAEEHILVQVSKRKQHVIANTPTIILYHSTT